MQSLKPQPNQSSYNSSEYIQIKINSNGHEVYSKLLKKNTAHLEIDYHIKNYKLPISVYISERDCHQPSEHSYVPLTTQETSYNLDTLTEQIQLFKTEQQIDEYIAMQKLLAHNVELKLTHLTKSLIQIIKLSTKNIAQSDGILSINEVEESNITKQRLNHIESKCMKTLGRIQEERRKMEICVVCWESARSVVFMPCMHMIVCRECAKVGRCPVCKGEIMKAVSVFK